MTAKFLTCKAIRYRLIFTVVSFPEDGRYWRAELYTQDPASRKMTELKKALPMRTLERAFAQLLRELSYEQLRDLCLEGIYAVDEVEVPELPQDYPR